MQIVIDIPNSDIPLKQNVITLDLHFIDGHICECTYPFKELLKGHGRLIDGDVVIAEICKEGTMAERQGTYQITMCEAKQIAVDIVSAIPTILEAEE